MHWTRRGRIGVIAVCCIVGLAIQLVAQIGHAADAPAAASTADIPELNWEQRSDWINVKTAVTPGAVGDGNADDTTAIQAALNKMVDSATIYFPPGRYRITKTLEFPAGRFLGVSLLGHGRTSTLVWDGAVGGRMLWNHDGLIVSRYVGLSWDGAGKAAVGFDHSALKIFETEIRHQHEAFRRFTEAGIRVGHEQKIATAETLYDNCLFEKCAHGISLRSFNDLDHTVDHCEFRGCRVGVYSGKGTNVYVRNSHFADSAEFDIASLGEAGSSVRHCTSRGSKQFLSHRSSVGPLVVQACHVADWTSPDAAIVLNGANVLLFDCQFATTSGESPAVQLGHAEQRLIAGQNRVPTGRRLLTADTIGKVIEIPADGATAVELPPASHSFLAAKVAIPGKVFDAKRDFGAKGDGTADDTDAIVRAIAAARAHGQGAIAYLPGGRFVVSKTLELSGSNYYFGGSGYRTALLWRGPTGGTTLSIRDPEGLTLENIAIGHHDCGVGDNAIDIQQTGTGKPSRMTYDRVWAWGMYQAKPLERGLRLTNLGPQDRVLFKEVNGNLHFTDAAAATIFLRLSYEGTVLLEGQSAARDGFIGGAVRLGTVTDPAIWLKDNQSLVMSDFYVESCLHHTRLEGNAALPAGRLTLQGAKFELSKPENNGLEVTNYRGEVVLGPYQYYVGNPLHHFAQQGDAPFYLTMLGPLFYNSQPEFKLGSSASLSVVGSYTVGLNKDDTVGVSAGVADSEVPRAMPQITRGLNDLRRLLSVEAALTDGP